MLIRGLRGQRVFSRLVLPVLVASGAACQSTHRMAHEYVEQTETQLVSQIGLYVRAVMEGDSAAIVAIAHDSVSLGEAVLSRQRPEVMTALRAYAVGFEVSDMELGPCSARLYLTSASDGITLRGVVEATYSEGWRVTQMRVPVEGDW